LVFWESRLGHGTGSDRQAISIGLAQSAADIAVTERRTNRHHAQTVARSKAAAGFAVALDVSKLLMSGERSTRR
jgi:hypothetical protein